MQGKALPGFRDFYPEDLAFRNHLFATWRSVAARYGFEEYDGPPLEPLELYTRKSGDEIVAQLYSFKDKGDRDVALRPEMTPTLARMVAARGAGPEEADSLVLHPAAVPLRAAAAGTAAGALPAQHGHHRRGGAAGRCRADRRRGRHPAGIRLGPPGCAGAAVGPAGASDPAARPRPPPAPPGGRL